MWNKLRGLTLTELLIVIAIIGLLLALLLPVIEAARDVARKKQEQLNPIAVGLIISKHIESECITTTKIKEYPETWTVRKTPQKHFITIRNNDRVRDIEINLEQYNKLNVGEFYGTPERE